MGKKPIASVTYKNERISIKNSLPYIKCVLRLSCVVHGPIYGYFMGSTVNGFLSVERFHSRGQPRCKFIRFMGTKKAFTQEKSSTPTGLVWDTNMAAGSLFWNANMAAVTSCDGNLCTNIIVWVAYGLIHVQIVQYGIV